MRVLAIDPGSVTGFAFSSIKDKVEASGVWHLSEFPEARPGVLLERIRKACAEYQPEILAYEVAAMGGRFQRASARLSELTGAIQAAIGEARCRPYAWNIGSWKKAAIGNGAADKAMIMQRLRIYFGISVGNENQADAIGILLASQMGPPPEPKRKARSRLKKAAKKMPRLF